MKMDEEEAPDLIGKNSLHKNSNPFLFIFHYFVEIGMTGDAEMIVTMKGEEIETVTIATEIATIETGKAEEKRVEAENVVIDVSWINLWVYFRSLIFENWA